MCRQEEGEAAGRDSQDELWFGLLILFSLYASRRRKRLSASLQWVKALEMCVSCSNAHICILLVLCKRLCRL